MKHILLLTISVALLNAEITLAPDGSYVDGEAQLAPDGSYVGQGDIELAPDGSYILTTPESQDSNSSY